MLRSTVGLWSLSIAVMFIAAARQPAAAAECTPVTAECDALQCDADTVAQTGSLASLLNDCRETSGVAMGGWISAGLTLNGDGNRSGTGNAPYGYNNVSDGVVVNQIWMFAERQIAEDGLDWGFRIDALFGTDGPDNQAFADQTWDFGWDSGRDYGAAIPQLYADVRIDDLAIRAGYFLTPIGWESVRAPLNFFYSHSYTFYYSEPNTHSGFLATYDVNDRLTLSGGWTMGMDSSFANDLHASTFLGGATLAISEQTTLTWSLLAGDWGDGTGRDGVPSDEGDIYIHSLILEHQVSDRCSYVLHNDLGANTNQATAPDAHWYAIVQYLMVEINDAWQAGTRVEWFRDDGGVRVGDSAADAGDYFEVTLGLNWHHESQWIVRPEVRWDAAGGGLQPFDDGSEDDFFTYAVNAVRTF
ncbi:outer membrane beta-barrel protein [Rosistilla oblonga]|uniref:Porin n=1 Tax=Rosistilla oblonga TaxID=2527990 RepID=A0A518ISZ0_9BACT|nr:outer membrane beta-barrel protein [Rosistilla oblonga]QDV56212.1 hypothetical protein Mal33_21930 [Rosistilla oblonga]